MCRPASFGSSRTGRAADEVAPLSGFTRDVPVPVVEPDPRQGPGPTIPPGVPPKPPPISRDEVLRFQLLGAVPAIVAGLALWLGTWIPLTRGLTAGNDAEIERRSPIRKLAIYLI